MLRKVPQINARLDTSLVAYAAAASAAGVGLLALAAPAEGKVVYTATNISIARNTVLPLDLNGDGIPDFSLDLGTYASHAEHLFIVADAKPNNIFSHSGEPAALFAGVPIGPKGRFNHYASSMAFWTRSLTSTYHTGGNWKDAHNRYLGLQFSIAGKIHYGWARLNVNVSIANRIVATLTGYAYETIPDKAIIAGAKSDPTVGSTPPAKLVGAFSHPASLGLLACGAHALNIWRREYTLAA